MWEADGILGNDGKWLSSVSLLLPDFYIVHDPEKLDPVTIASRVSTVSAYSMGSYGKLLRT